MTASTRFRFASILLILGIGVGLSTAGLLFVGCGEKNHEIPPLDVIQAPTNLTSVNGNERVTLTWDASDNESSTNFKQYNIYRGEVSLIGVDPTQLDQLGHKIGSVPQGTTTLEVPVTNGTLYFFHVRAEPKEGSLTDRTNEVQAAGREEGVGVVIDEFISTAGASGFDFSTGLPVSLRTSNPNRFVADIYLGTTDTTNQDKPGGNLAIKSPELIALHTNADPQWGNLQPTSIKTMATTDWNVDTVTNIGQNDQVAVATDNFSTIYAFKTRDGNYAKIKIDAADLLQAGSRTITFRYAYQTTPNLDQF